MEPDLCIGGCYNGGLGAHIGNTIMKIPMTPVRGITLTDEEITRYDLLTWDYTLGVIRRREDGTRQLSSDQATGLLQRLAHNIIVLARGGRKPDHELVCAYEFVRDKTTN